MISMDKLENMETFPKPLEYLKLSIVESLSFLIPNLIILGFIFSDSLNILSILLISYIFTITFINYRLDKQIFNALKKRK